MLIMKYSAIIFFILFSKITYSSQYRAFQYDNNKDKKTDATHYYSKSQIVLIERDKNYDGQIDFKRNYQVNGYIYTDELDTNYDNVFDTIRKVSLSLKSLKVENYIRKNNQLKLISEYKLPIIQSIKEDCNYINRDNVLNEITSFVEKFDKTLRKSNNGTSSISNYKIDQSCISNFGKKTFSKVITEANKIGLSCLTKLAKEEIKSKNQIELFNLLNIMDSSLKSNTWNVTIDCSDKKGFNDGKDNRKHGALAKASTGPIKHNNYSHPFISINPYKKTGLFGNISKKELTSVVFHEMIHNYGYTHGSGIDMAYGCEVCCFPNEFPKKARKYGCNVCKGDYTSDKDSKYVKDISLLSFHSKLVTGKELFSRNYKEFKNNKETQASFIASTMNFGPELIYELQKQTSAVTKSYDEDLLRKIEGLKFYKHGNKTLALEAKKSATLLSSIFFSKNKNDILKALNSIKYREISYIPTRHASLRSYPGGNSLLTNIETSLQMALKSERDPELRRAYLSKLYLIDSILSTK